MTNTKEYIREYYRKRRERLYEQAPDPETHPLRIWRKENGLSMAAAGRLLETSDAMVWHWERGLVPTPEWVLDIIQDGMTDYMRRKLGQLNAQRREQYRSNPIRLWRKRHGKTREETAELLGVRPSTLANWERECRTMPLWVPYRLEEMEWM